jgi:NAD(P)-dependent dehydrogenase (short-subunit alcohol dehydrogenase family)
VRRPKSPLRKPVPLSTEGRAVLITGASTGLGRAGALHLERVGYRVFAGVRRAEDGEKLLADSAYGRLEPVLLDVTDADGVRATADTIAGTLGPGGLWALVNNAGISIPGPLECVTAEQLRLQLETNVVGQLTTIQAFLPLLRRTRGRIVNVTSGLGRIALPYLGAYAAAQFAKEGLSDALRRELAPFGVTVCVVQPGAIMTPIWEKLAMVGQRGIADAGPVADLYRDTFLRFLAMNEAGAKQSRTTPEDFARVVAEALTAPRPRTRYTVGADMRLASVLARVLPDTALDKRFAPIVAP